MNLIDEDTPDGFFHMRLVPYKIRNLRTKEHAGFPQPDPTADSYFETPVAADTTASAPLTAKAVVITAQERWDAGAPLIAEMCATLPVLVDWADSQHEDADQPEVSDFVYPLF